MKILSSAAAGNGTSTRLSTLTSKSEYGVYAGGTFDGATVKLQISPDNGTTFMDVPNASWTAAGYNVFTLHGTHVRGVVTGGTTPAADMWVD